MEMSEEYRFSVADYVVFSLVLGISAAIGFYYAFTGGKQRTVEEFLMANRNMSWFPVAASLLASFMSAITIIGTPGEIYSYGTVYIWLILSHPIAIWLSAYVYLPVFYRLKLTSMYEYLDLRFNKAVKFIAVIIYIIAMLLYMGMVLYAPSMAFMQATGLNLWISILSVGIVCTIYTTLGGMKAVLWTDTFQIFIMYAGIIAVIIQGCINEGGGAAVWETARKSGRLDFYDTTKIFDVDPRTRHSFWSQMIGGIFGWCSIYATNQAQVQRALTLSKISIMQKAYWFNVPGLSTFALLCSFCGLIIYSHFKLCDPLTTGDVITKDQLYPLYVIKTLGQYPGLPGVVLASVFSGSLSTVSSAVNALAAVTLKDVVQVFKPNMSDRHATWMSKILAMFYGAVAIIVASLAKELGAGLLSAAAAIYGALGGPILGLFSLGLFFPSANSWGALAGLLFAIGCNAWLSASQLLNRAYVYKYPTSVAGCNITENSNFTFANISTAEYTYDPSTFNPSAHHRTGVESLYDISYQWLTMIGCLLVIVVGLLVSACTGNNRRKPVDGKLLTPVFHQWCCCLPMRIRKKLTLNVQPYDEDACIEKSSGEMVTIG